MEVMRGGSLSALREGRSPAGKTNQGKGEQDISAKKRGAAARDATKSDTAWHPTTSGRFGGVRPLIWKVALRFSCKGRGSSESGRFSAGLRRAVTTDRDRRLR